MALRRESRAGPQVIAAIVGRPASTVGKVLRRAAAHGCARPERDPVRPLRARAARRALPRRHQEARPLLGVGKRIRKDGCNRNRHAGWSYLHIAIDDHTRLAYAELLKERARPDCAAFLRRAPAWYAEQGITIERVLADNANGLPRARSGQAACAELGISRRYTRPYSPGQTAKPKRSIKTLLREWAYRHTYPTSSHRARALSGYLRWYNNHRPHGSLGARPPISRVSHVCDYFT